MTLSKYFISPGDFLQSSGRPEWAWYCQAKWGPESHDGYSPSIPSLCAPFDVRARLAMEVLREDFDNGLNVPTGNSPFNTEELACPLRLGMQSPCRGQRKDTVMFLFHRYFKPFDDDQKLVFVGGPNCGHALVIDSSSYRPGNDGVSGQSENGTLRCVLALTLSRLQISAQERPYVRRGAIVAPMATGSRPRCYRRSVA